MPQLMLTSLFRISEWPVAPYPNFGSLAHAQDGCRSYDYEVTGRPVRPVLLSRTTWRIVGISSHALAGDVYLDLLIAGQLEGHCTHGQAYCVSHSDRSTGTLIARTLLSPGHSQVRQPGHMGIALGRGSCRVRYGRIRSLGRRSITPDQIGWHCCIRRT
ncbi:hypothetical protein OE88DRAFT_721385 [Heliocybe sulcata]|uniref:Uncharacterized protein n=1 Tax=Heliocybe sulcata TaxID=5364 RepID=A0A5C3NH43_9AGAM|nr:hypothetical protein OE88DRAFT_721385 [Heliocybe sulcata]